VPSNVRVAGSGAEETSSVNVVTALAGLPIVTKSLMKEKGKLSPEWIPPRLKVCPCAPVIAANAAESRGIVTRPGPVMPVRKFEVP
jgi:hypothetical protein